MSTAANKTATSLTNLAASTISTGATATSQWVDLTTTLKALVNGYITWSGSLTTGPTITVEESPDNGTTVYPVFVLTGPTGSSPFNLPEVPVDPASKYARVSVKNNDGSVTITARFHMQTIDSVG